MPVLKLVGLPKSFGAIEAMRNVSLDIAQDEVIGLMGDNGAGKSTLVKIIAGNFRASAGQLFIRDHAVQFHGPLDARRHGIEIVYQDLALCDNLTAAANVFLGRELTRRFGPIRINDTAARNHRAAKLFLELKSETRPRDLVRQMSGGQRQAVAIARIRLSNADIMLMAEPTAAISVRQVVEVLNLIRHLRDLGGSRGTDQPSDAGCLRAGQPRGGGAARHCGRRQGGGPHVTRGSDRIDHRNHRTCLIPSPSPPIFHR